MNSFRFFTDRNKNCLFRMAKPLCSRYYAGIGSILLFHRIVNNTSESRVGGAKHLEAPIRFFEELISYLRCRGYAFVSMDEVHEILTRNKPISRFVAFTFDDGFRDNFTTALPFLSSQDIPFTLYVTTDHPDREFIPWMHLLEQKLLEHDNLHFDFGGREYHYTFSSPADRESAFSTLASLFDRGTVEDVTRLASDLFGKGPIEAAKSELSISWTELKKMSQHPLVTIGAHTISHPVLNNLDLETARNEIAGSKNILEKRLNMSIRHFSYPFGSRYHVGKREFDLAREAGFDTATTTRLANIFPEHSGGLHSLPRIFGNDLADLKIGISGTKSAFRYRGRRIITD